MRIGYGDAFTFDRVISLYFYTSNADKLLQARLMFMRSGYDIRHYSINREPYDEDYTSDTRGLLTMAVKQLVAGIGIRSPFFLEDTSLRIESFSGDSDFPGMKVKEWFGTTTFDKVDHLLREKGNNRRATVYSDIALHLPTLSRPLYFHGETSGCVADAPPAFLQNDQYPWLTPDTFNGWFVPDGTSRRLGEMEFEESLEFDFRAKAITDLIARVEELNAALNLRPNQYTTRRGETEASKQLSLIPDTTKTVWIVIGDKCAGKTTLSDHVGSRGGVHVLEASTVLRRLGEEEGEEIKSSEGAMRFLAERGLDVVAQRISEYIEKSDLPINIVTGLRTSEEILCLLQSFPQAKLIRVEADPRIRYARHVRRARDQDIKTFGDFRNLDEKQAQFGVMRIAHELQATTIVNETTLDAFHSKIDDVLRGAPALGSRSLTPRQIRRTELHRTLRALRRIGRIATCQEISEETVSEGFVRKYNTNRALKEIPEFAKRIETKRGRLSYELTSRGAALVTLFDILFDQDRRETGSTTS